MDRWRHEAIQAGRKTEGVVVAYEAGRDGLGLAGAMAPRVSRSWSAGVMAPTARTLFRIARGFALLELIFAWRSAVADFVIASGSRVGPSFDPPSSLELDSRLYHRVATRESSKES